MSPGKVWETGEGWYEIEESPGDDDAVVDIQPEDDGHGGVANSLNTTTWAIPIKGGKELGERFGLEYQTAWRRDFCLEKLSGEFVLSEIKFWKINLPKNKIKESKQ